MTLLNLRTGTYSPPTKKSQKPLRKLLRDSKQYISNPPKIASNLAIQLDDTKLANQIVEQVVRQLTDLIPTIGLPIQKPGIVDDSFIEIDTSIVDVGIEEKEIEEGKFNKPIKENNDIVQDKSLSKSRGKLKEKLRGKRK